MKSRSVKVKKKKKLKIRVVTSKHKTIKKKTVNKKKDTNKKTLKLPSRFKKIKIKVRLNHKIEKIIVQKS